jgi:uracil-DNA glycosylase
MLSLRGDWLVALAEEIDKPYYENLCEFLQNEYAFNTVYPPMKDIFTAFNLTPLHEVKVVVIGQDPYHNERQAHGLCFSVIQEQDKIPPSLQNIYKELNRDLGLFIPNNGYLHKWATQGVLLLNTILSVRAHMANSHQKKGWEQFTDATICAVNEIDRPVVFLLWGKLSQAKKKMLTNPKHCILEAPHPSPLSAYRGFIGCNHFSLANDFLSTNGLEPIDWQIEDI